MQVPLAGESYLVGGDLIVSADGVPVGSLARLRDLVAAKKPGDTMTLSVYRGGKRKTVVVTLGREPGT